MPSGQFTKRIEPRGKPAPLLPRRDSAEPDVVTFHRQSVRIYRNQGGTYSAIAKIGFAYIRFQCEARARLIAVIADDISSYLHCWPPDGDGRSRRRR